MSSNFSNDEPGFGTFGQVGNLKGGGPKRFSVFKIVAFIFVILLVPLAYVGWKSFYSNFLERVPPIILISSESEEKLPAGLGLEDISFIVHVKDRGAGLDEVVIRAEQGRDVSELARKTYNDRGVKEDKIPLTLSRKKNKFKEGNLKIRVAAFDKTFWSNKKFQVLDLKVDFVPPKLDVLTTQHNSIHGGSELVFFKVSEEKELFSWLTVGSELFPGFRAVDLDPSFKNHKDLYFTFYPVPLEFEIGKDKIFANARDVVGNHTTKSFNFRVKPLDRIRRVANITDGFIENRINTLYKQFLESPASTGLQLPELVTEGVTESGKLERFRVVNKDYRNYTEAALTRIFKSPKAKRYWSGSFTRFPSSNTRTMFGETIDFKYMGRDAGTYVSKGLDLKGRRKATVRAANEGIVIYADNLAAYGNTVVIDHGFGLTTLYAYLDKVDCSEGDRLKKGQSLGRVGITGFTDVEQLHFEVRLHGIPVRPEEWFDKVWVKEHIEKKINSVKKSLGIRVLRPLKDRGLSW